MRKVFNEYIKKNPKEIEELWNNAIISFDTNVLLDLYRYEPETANDFLTSMEAFSDKVWLTHQVGYEFFKNRNDSFLYVDNVSNYLALILQQFGNLTSCREMKEGHKANKLIGESIKQIYAQVKDVNEKYEKHLSLLKENDVILKRLLILFDGKTEAPLSKDILEKIYTEGERRYKESVPPGYKDEKDKNKLHKRTLYGDLIIWKSLINKAKSEQKDMVFITNDQKSDWVLEVHGRKAGARPELIREFNDETGKDILIYNSNNFLDYAKSNLNTKPSETTIQNVKEINDEHEKSEKQNIKTHYPLYQTNSLQSRAKELSEMFSFYEKLKIINEQMKPLWTDKLIEDMDWYRKYFPYLNEPD